MANAIFCIKKIGKLSVKSLATFISKKEDLTLTSVLLMSVGFTLIQVGTMLSIAKQKKISLWLITMPFLNVFHI